MSDLHFEQPEESEGLIRAPKPRSDLSPPPMQPLSPRQRIAQAQLANVEALAAKARAAASPAEAAQWQQTVNDLTVHMEQAETFREERRYETWWERRLTYLTLAVGCGAVFGGTVLCCVGHPLVGSPVIGGGLDIIRQALARPKKKKSDSNEK